MNKKGQIGIVVGVLVVILILGVGAYFVLQKDGSGDKNGVIVNNSNDAGNIGDWCSGTGGAMKMKVAQSSIASVTNVGYVTYKNERRCNIQFTISNGMTQDWYVDVDAGFTSGRPNDWWDVISYGTGKIELHYVNDKCVDLTCVEVPEEQCRTLKSVQCLGISPFA